MSPDWHRVHSSDGVNISVLWPWPSCMTRVIHHANYNLLCAKSDDKLLLLSIKWSTYMTHGSSFPQLPSINDDFYCLVRSPLTRMSVPMTTFKDLELVNSLMMDIGAYCNLFALGVCHVFFPPRLIRGSPRGNTTVNDTWSSWLYSPIRNMLWMQEDLSSAQVLMSSNLQLKQWCHLMA